MKTPANLGMLLLAVWFIITGVIALFGVTFPYSGQIMAALAIVVGVLLLMRR